VVVGRGAVVGGTVVVGRGTEVELDVGTLVVELVDDDDVDEVLGTGRVGEYSPLSTFSPASILGNLQSSSPEVARDMNDRQILAGVAPPAI
jgi:hypothetical protein